MKQKLQVPWDDLTNNANGLVAGVGEIFTTDWQHLSGELVSPSGVVAQAIDRGWNITSSSNAKWLTFKNQKENIKIRLFPLFKALISLFDLPLSSDSRAANCSRSLSINSASLSIRAARSVPFDFLHGAPILNALFAASTAKFTSALIIKQ
jgi:hypothetical protein